MPMPGDEPLRPFTPEWADALCVAVNASETYRVVAARWTWPVALVLTHDASLGFPHDTAVVLTLEHGRCKAVKVVEGKHARAPFIFRAPYRHWKRIVRGEADAIIAVVKGEVAFTGSMSALMLHSRAAKALVECARAVPTRFPDEEPRSTADAPSPEASGA